MKEEELGGSRTSRIGRSRTSDRGTKIVCFHLEVFFWSPITIITNWRFSVIVERNVAASLGDAWINNTHRCAGTRKLVMRITLRREEKKDAPISWGERTRGQSHATVSKPGADKNELYEPPNSEHNAALGHLQLRTWKIRVAYFKNVWLCFSYILLYIKYDYTNIQIYSCFHAFNVWNIKYI